jgi:uncharacterized membrane protein
VEIVPAKRLVWLDWSVNDAMSFIVSGGTMTPKGIRMNPAQEHQADAKSRVGAEIQ